MQVNSGDPDQTPHSVASDLGLRCLPMSHIKDARHIHVWVNKKRYGIKCHINELGFSR